MRVHRARGMSLASGVGGVVLVTGPVSGVGVGCGRSVNAEAGGCGFRVCRS